MSNNFQTGKFQLQPSDLNHRDVSTVRRTLGVHEQVVIAAWNTRSLLSRLLISASTITDAAIEKAGAAE